MVVGRCDLILWLSDFAIYLHTQWEYNHTFSHNEHDQDLQAQSDYTVKDQKYFHNVRNSIDLRVFSCLQEKLPGLSWSTYFHDFGPI